MRCSTNHLTARASTTHSTSRPIADKRLGIHRVVDPLDVLLDDRAFVQVAGDEVGGGADQLDAALVRLRIRLGALEAGQEGMVDVDRACPRSASHSPGDRICM